jgi:hypothetical protein
MSIEYRCMPLSDAMPHILTMLPAQWGETGDSEYPCEPNWPMYAALETAGALIVLVAFDRNCAIGYLAALVHPHMNSRQVKIGTISTYYMEPGMSRALRLRSMISCAINLMRRQGVAEIVVDTEYNHSFGRVLDAMGFSARKVGYTMKIGNVVPMEKAV